jgi:glycosyltransferase involved in cell wall biosynthesis
VKVAITHPYSWPDVRRGAERITVETAAALTRRGHDVTLFTASKEAERRFDPSGFEIVKFCRRHESAARHERYFAWRLLPHLVRRRFDTVHSLMPRDARAAIRTRRLGGHHVVYEELGNPLTAWWDTQPDAAARRDVVRRADAYGCMSTFSLGILREQHGREGVLIPGGVRLDEMVPATARAERPTILFSGACNDPQKGVAQLLEAVATLAAHEPRVELWLSGPDDPAALLAAAPPAARERTVALPLGEPGDQAERYGRAWVTALPSSDSFGLVLLESLACGTPVVTLASGAAPELASPGTGVIAEPNDRDALAAALAEGLELARDPDVVSRCRDRASGYSWDALAERLEGIYAAAGENRR